MPSVRINRAARWTVILVAVAGCGWYLFSSRRIATVSLPPDSGRSARTVPWVGISPGSGDVFVINPVYPPQVVGELNREVMRVIPVARLDAGQNVAVPEPVFVVNPTFPPQVTGTLEPLSNGRGMESRPLAPMPPLERQGTGALVRKAAEGR